MKSPTGTGRFLLQRVAQKRVCPGPVTCQLGQFLRSRPDFRFQDRFDKAVGTSTVRREIEAGWDYYRIQAKWMPGIEAYRTKIKKYMIYK